MKKITQALIGASLITGAQAASLIAITGDASASDTGDFNWLTVGNTVSDTASYDPDNPTAATFTLAHSNINNAGFHGNKTSGTHTLSYLVTGGHTTTALSPTVALDFYGRNSSELRDNNYTVTLYNGDYTTVVGTAATNQAADDTTFYNRTEFTLGAGVTFDRFQITSPAGTTDATRYFSIAEVRLASVPEPSSTALLGLGGLALILRRRK